MTPYKLHSLHLGCGEPLAAHYRSSSQPVTEQKRRTAKPAQVKTGQLTERKRK